MVIKMVAKERRAGVKRCCGRYNVWWEKSGRKRSSMIMIINVKFGREYKHESNFSFGWMWLSEAFIFFCLKSSSLSVKLCYSFINFKNI